MSTRSAQIQIPFGDFMRQQSEVTQAAFVNMPQPPFEEFEYILSQLRDRGIKQMLSIHFGGDVSTQTWNTTVETQGD